MTAGQARLPADPGLARQVHARRAVHGVELQPEADRRAVLQRGLGRERWHRCAAPARVQLAARLRRPRHAHGHDRRRGTTTSRRPATRRRFGADQRHRAAGPHRRVQGLLPDAGRRQLLHLGQRRRHRPGSRRRRRRPELLDLGLADELPRPGRGRLPLRGGRGRLRRRLGGEQRARRPRRSPIGGPWLTTVAAGTHNRNGEGSVTLGNGDDLRGSVVRDGAVLEAHRRLGRRRPASGVRLPPTPELCFPGSLDPAQVSGKIVLCKRGGQRARREERRGCRGRRSSARSSTTIRPERTTRSR